MDLQRLTKAIAEKEGLNADEAQKLYACADLLQSYFAVEAEPVRKRVARACVALAIYLDPDQSRELMRRVVSDGADAAAKGTRVIPLEGAPFVVPDNELKRVLATELGGEPDDWKIVEDGDGPR